MRNITLLATVAAGLFLQLAATAAPKTYYIAPDGKDTNKGTIESPFATFNKAQEFVQPGDGRYIQVGDCPQDSGRICRERTQEEGRACGGRCFDREAGYLV